MVRQRTREPNRMACSVLLPLREPGHRTREVWFKSRRGVQGGEGGRWLLAGVAAVGGGVGIPRGVAAAKVPCWQLRAGGCRHQRGRVGGAVLALKRSRTASSQG